MKLFKLFAGIMAFFALFMGVSLLFPRTYRVERSIEVNLSPDSLFNYLNDIKNWKDWSPWNESLDTSMKTFYSRNSTGKGGTQYFKGDRIGVGYFRIVESQPAKSIAYILTINDGTLKSGGTFLFEPRGSQTKLSWIDEGDVGYHPIHRYQVPFKESSTGKAFEEGLVEIKKAAERKFGNK